MQYEINTAEAKPRAHSSPRGSTNINNGRRMTINENNQVHGNSVLSCAFPNCKFTTTKGERGVNTHHRKIDIRKNEYN